MVKKNHAIPLGSTMEIQFRLLITDFVISLDHGVKIRPRPTTMFVSITILFYGFNIQYRNIH
jgi:hypothetical protein